MQKSRFLIGTALAALALCASAFAASPPASTGGAPATVQAFAGSHDVAPAAAVGDIALVKVAQAANDVSTVSRQVADTGSGAESAYQAWFKRQGVASAHPGYGQREQHPMAGAKTSGWKRSVGAVNGMDLQPALMTIRDMHLAPIPRRPTRST